MRYWTKHFNGFDVAINNKGQAFILSKFDVAISHENKLVILSKTEHETKPMIGPFETPVRAIEFGLSRFETAAKAIWFGLK